MNNQTITKDAARDAGQPVPVTYSLRRFTSNERLSQETLCFVADLYADDEKIAEVRNAGHGGDSYPHAYSGKREKLDAFYAWIKTLPPDPCDFGDKQPIAITADYWLSTQAEHLNEQKALKRLCSKKTLFRKPGQVYQLGTWDMVKAPFDARVKAYIQNKYPGARILNETMEEGSN